MKNVEKKNLAASVKQRLSDKSKLTGRSNQELLQFYSMERFLYRLSQSRFADHFILKGALMLVAWQAPFARSTMDMDLEGKGSNRVEDIRTAIRDILLTEVEPDGVIFDAEDIGAELIATEGDFHGVRILFNAFLERSRVQNQLDIGFGDIIVPEPMVLNYPVLLDFPTPHILGYTRESAIAEKLMAMVEHDFYNSRMKDFYDIWLLSRHFDFSGAILSRAIAETFRNRGREIPAKVIALLPEFYDNPNKLLQWKAFVRRTRLDAMPTDFPETVRAIAEFLGPVIEAARRGILLNLDWKSPGPWIK